MVPWSIRDGAPDAPLLLVEVSAWRGLNRQHSGAGRRRLHTFPLYLNHRCVIPLHFVQTPFPPNKAFLMHV